MVLVFRCCSLCDFVLLLLCLVLVFCDCCVWMCFDLCVLLLCLYGGDFFGVCVMCSLCTCFVDGLCCVMLLFCIMCD